MPSTNWRWPPRRRPGSAVTLPATGPSVRQVDAIGQVTTLPVVSGQVQLTLDGAPRIFHGLVG